VLPKDVTRPTIQRKRRLIKESISISELLSDLVEKGPTNVVLFLSACRDDPRIPLETMAFRRRGGLSAMSAPPGTFILFSAAAGQVALDRLQGETDPKHSVYVRELLPLLRQKELELKVLADRVRNSVYNLTQRHGYAQRPSQYDDIFGKFCLGGCSDSNSPVSPIHPPIDPSGEEWYISYFKDVTFYEGDAKNNPIHKNVSSLRNCESICEGNKECLIFTYLPNERSCRLKSSLGTPHIHRSAISGYYERNKPFNFPIAINWDIRPDTKVTFDTNERNWSSADDVKECADQCMTRVTRSCKAFTKYKTQEEPYGKNCELPRIFYDTYFGTRDSPGDVTGVRITPRIINPYETRKISGIPRIGASN